MTEEDFPDALPPGHRLHWYVLERVLGQGGFGITYLAHDSNLDRRVAIKEYLPAEVARRRSDASARPLTESHAERFAWGLERFLAEARTLARFDHPNIVRVLSIFEANSTAYMVMRFEEGEDLGSLLERRGTLPERELKDFLMPVLGGLQLIHSSGFIHRDVKPENIYMRDDGSPVLLDFGSARQSFGSARTMTILVAPGYAPLEQYYGDAKTQGPWTDIYGLAATCYRAVTGRAPLDAVARAKGVLGSTRDLLEPAAALAQGSYDARLLAAIDHALQLSERDRPQSIAEWRREIVAPAAGADAARSDDVAERSPPRDPATPVAAPAVLRQAPVPMPVSRVDPTAPLSPATASARLRWPAAAVVIGIAAIVAIVFVRRPSSPGEAQVAAADRPVPVSAALPATTLPVASDGSVATRAMAPDGRGAGERDRPAVAPGAASATGSAIAPSVASAPGSALAPAAAPLVTPATAPTITPVIVKDPAAAVASAKETKSASPRVVITAPTTLPARGSVAPPMPGPATTTTLVAPPRNPGPAPSAATVAPALSPPVTAASAPAPVVVTAAATTSASPTRRRDEQLDAAEAALRRGDAATAAQLAAPWASAGSPRAQTLLGRAQEARSREQHNDFEAYVWYGIAVRNGEATAQALKDKVAGRLQPAEIRQAEQIVERWKPRAEPVTEPAAERSPP